MSKNDLAESRMLQKNIKIVRQKGDSWSLPLVKMVKASYEFARISFKQELEREARISSALNVKLVILGFLVSGVVSLLVNNKSNACHWLLLSALIILLVNLVFLLFSFSYRKRIQMDSPCKIANNIIEQYIDDEDTRKFNEDGEALTEGNFIFSIEPSYQDLCKQNDISRTLLKVSDILTFISVIALIVSLFFITFS